MEWLDKDTFANARVGLNASGSPDFDYPWGATATPALDSTRVVWSQGFRLTKIDQCTITLRNEDTQLLGHSTGIVNDSKQRSAELYLPLNKLSYCQGKRAYRHTRDLDKARLLGTWRTEFKSNFLFLFPRASVGLALFDPGTKVKIGFWPGETVTFTFDTKDMAEGFDAAFRRAIKLCK